MWPCVCVPDVSYECRRGQDCRGQEAGEVLVGDRFTERVSVRDAAGVCAT